MALTPNSTLSYPSSCDEDVVFVARHYITSSTSSTCATCTNQRQLIKKLSDTVSALTERLADVEGRLANALGCLDSPLYGELLLDTPPSGNDPNYMTIEFNPEV